MKDKILAIGCSKRRLRSIRKIAGLAKELQVYSKEFKETLLLDRKKYGYFEWHRVALFGRLQALET
jgi:hypothetical protein